MESHKNDLEPKLLWKHFFKLTQIPRPSKHEEQVVEYIEAFAKQKNLEYIKDEVGNLVVKKAASASKENDKVVCLQAHVDMVPQKNNDKQHDFTKDPIETIIDGEWLRANETTLGADNGIGVAAMLAVLEDDNMQHGPIEALFTINEEAGMDGAFALSDSILKSDILLNLDSEDEGELFVSCAGGLDANINWVYNQERSLDGLAGIRVDVSGLKGGHSGLDINKGRANANKLLAKIALQLSSEFGAELQELIGGNLRNAIPREGHMVLLCPAKELDAAKARIQELGDSFKQDFAVAEPDMSFDISHVEPNGGYMETESKKHALNMLNTCPNGMIAMSQTMPGVVETSINMAVVNIQDGRSKVQCLIRSANDKAKKDLAEQVEGLFKLGGAEVGFAGDYPGWLPNPDSFVLKHAQSVFTKVYGKDPEIKAIHAGLECGIIGGKYPKLDMISFGPTIRYPHSPDEKVHIASVARFWVALKELLAEI